MKALFCLYSAPLIESARASSTPLAGNLRRGRVQGRQRNGGGGQKPSHRSKLRKGRSLAQSISLRCLRRRTVRAGKHGGRLWPRCPAPCKLGERSRCYKGRKGANGDARKKKGTALGRNQLQHYQKPPSKVPAPGKPSTCSLAAEPRFLPVLLIPIARLPGFEHLHHLSGHPSHPSSRRPIPPGMELPNLCTRSREATLMAAGERRQSEPGLGK